MDDRKYGRAIAAVRNGDCSEKHAAMMYGVPRQTMRRYLKNDKTAKLGLGRPCAFGVEAEMELVNYIKDLSKHGFSLTRLQVRSLAFDFAEKLQIPNRFNKNTRLAGWDWLWAFIRRHPDLFIGKEENLSVNRALSMMKEVVGGFINLLEENISSLNLLGKPERIFNMDESGFQLNTKPASVITQKGQKVMHRIAPKERGETITLVASFNAAGNYLPPVLIIKGKRTIIGLKEQLPLGAEVYMNQQSAYINGGSTKDSVLDNHHIDVINLKV